MQLHELVQALPEVYQPIFGHPELSENSSRDCKDRLVPIVAIYSAMEAMMERPLRVLDLGCAQGFFSHALASMGAKVDGIDFLEANIAVCKAIAHERGDLKTNFQVAKIEDVVSTLEPSSYDLVLGLSVFHHLAQQKSVSYVQKMINELGKKTTACILELALAEEPMEWAAIQTKDSRELISDFAFVHEVARHKTHLSHVDRPLYYVSNSMWYLDGHTSTFHEWKPTSNVIVPDAYGDTRRIYFDDNSLVKLYRLEKGSRSDLTIDEWENEIAFLSTPPTNFKAPKLKLAGKNSSELWIVREFIPGRTLAEYVLDSKDSYDAKKVLLEILTQIVALENAGLYHNDVRAWNVVIDAKGSAFLIDYGAISENRNDCAWPHNIYLSFIIFMREVLLEQLEFPIPVRSIWLSPDGLPEPYRSAIWHMLQFPLENWQFSKLLEIIDLNPIEISETDKVDRTSVAQLLNTLENAGEKYRSHIEWLESRILE